MGLGSNEQRICDLTSQGRHYTSIARELGIKPASVRRIQGYLNDSPMPDIKRDSLVREGSIAMLAALRAAGHCPDPNQRPADECSTCGNTDAECSCPGELEEYGVND
ncbi:helix-turn-helix transcriptional regulator [Aurantiacibacter zhengii]|uniref:Helix-turn-helix transcriptional regulator n=1 Tax=Aurantiacibacter zhengii TaxID=2307003 RepID=A0A418NTU7_9SPHN|nr:helix-turn-helix transcriptional regulator [Aurantiacibacter zhengii]RIV87473.1 helix-turn-helix transcriptional regulator [Aurantiacibacter zhengii]